MKNNLILALDTTADSVSVALLKGEKVVAHTFQQMERGQGEALIPMIQGIFKSAKVDFQNLSKVAVSIGPGSFTGVRIGLATARGIGLALDIPVIGVTSFEAAAYGTKEKVLVVLDSKREDFFTQTFLNGEPTEEPRIRSEEEILKLNPPAVIGSGVLHLSKSHIPVIRSTHEPAVAVGLCSFQKEHAPEPLYLRDADVSL